MAEQHHVYLIPGLFGFAEVGGITYCHHVHEIRSLHGIGSDGKAHYPTPTPQQARVLVDRYSEVPGAIDSDGIVPTRSQLWGELIYAGKGDHLDVCDHFDDPEHDPPHYDWLATGSGFDRPQFKSLWGSVTDFLLRSPS